MTVFEAMEITNETYPIYLAMPTAKDEDKLDLEDAKNHFMIRNIHHVESWRCVSRESFDKNFEFSDPYRRPTFRLLIEK